MFKSTKDFDKAVCNMLTNLRDNELWTENPPEMNETDFGDIMEFAIKRGLIIGLNGTRTMNGNYILQTFGDNQIRITREGLSFIENFKP